jgi:four helix bundle protein
MIQKLKDLEVYVRSYDLAMQIFKTSRVFPKEEVYSLTSQITRSSRSISANISEGWAKREYEQVFKQHLIHSLGSASETQTWVDFSYDCGYITLEMHRNFSEQLDTIGKMLTNLHKKWKSR